MMKIIKNNPIKLISLGLLIVILGLNCLGFCFDKMRVLSDDEKIRIAISHVLKQYEYDKVIIDNGQVPRGESDNSFESENIKFPLYPISYRDISEFLELNPNCCHVTLKHKSKNYEGSAYEIGFCEFISGQKTSIVVVHYIFKYKDSTGKVNSKTADWFSGMNNCGQLKQEY